MIKRNFFLTMGMAVLLNIPTADAQSLTKVEAEKAKAEICSEWKAATKEKYQKEWNEKIVRVDSLMMPFVVRTYDEKPADGYRGTWTMSPVGPISLACRQILNRSRAVPR